MERRLTSFLALSLLIFIGSIYLEAIFNPPKQNQANPAAQNAAGKPAAGKPLANAKLPAKSGEHAEKPAAAKPGEKPVVAAAKKAEENIKPQTFTFGSLGAGYKMLVTATNRGAAIESIEMSDPKYGDLDNRHGYLGRLAPEAPAKGKGSLVNAVGDGTPAAAAGMKPGDVVTAINATPIDTPQKMLDVLDTTDPGQQISITVDRAGKTQKLTAKLTRYPLPVMSPEANTEPLRILPAKGHDPLSFLATLHQIDDEKTDPAQLDDEIKGVDLRNGLWDGKQIDANTVEFKHALAGRDLEVVKRYAVAKIEDNPNGPPAPAYHLKLHVEVRNIGKKQHEVALQLDGPTGLPTEGWWYSYRISHEWSTLGLRDVAVKFQGQNLILENSMPLADQKLKEEEAQKNNQPLPKDEVTPTNNELADSPLAYVGIDAQYFAAMLIPQNAPRAGQKASPWFDEIRPLIVGEVPKDKSVQRKVDCTCRLTNVSTVLDAGQTVAYDYQVFVGPKQPALLDQYGNGPGNTLEPLVYYGWFSWVAAPMVAVLELFHSIIGNYGVAILMLTILVRLCMFPLSRKQAISARKMQELQPEMKKINEKFKTNAEQRTKAMQELWRKHDYNPMGGCLLVFVQLPIFMGLYRSLMVNVELRQASLLGHGIRWCSNLSAPDMLWNWTGTVPDFLAAPTAWLGPYFNLLPVLTVGLFVWQQSMFMPPSTDDNSAMQQKIMKFMTLAMGFLYFKVASGLCLYFIASSAWGIAERKLLPKTLGPTTPAPAAAAQRAATATSSNGSSARGESKKKQRGRKG